MTANSDTNPQYPVGSEFLKRLHSKENNLAAFMILRPDIDDELASVSISMTYYEEH